MMATRTSASAVATALLIALAALPAHGADLIEVYQRALQNDPQIREADATRLAQREARPQALSALLPQLAATGSYGVGDSTITEPLASVLLQSGSASAPDVNPNARFTRETKTHSTYQYQLQLVQTIFRWDRFANLKRSDAQVAQAEIDYKSAEQDLVLRVAQRYFNVLAAKDTVDAAQATLESVTRQLEQADKRFEVGLIAITDVQEARAAHDQAAATLIASKRTYATNLELLRELTGEAFDKLAAPGDDMPLQTPQPENEDQWVAAALQQNLSLISARFGADIAKEDVRIARGGHYPTIDLVATRNGVKSDADDTTSGLGPNFTLPGDLTQHQNQIALQVTVPLYSGGETSSRVRQAVYQHRASRERLERTSRETERATRDAYLGILSEISRIQALKQAVESSRTALQATEAGFEVGTRTTVDVLNSRQQLFTALTNYSRSRYDYVIDIITLKQAAGSLTRDDLKEINGWLKQE